MTTVDALRKYHDLIRSGELALSASERNLFIAILGEWNHMGRPKILKASYAFLMQLAGIGSKKTYYDGLLALEMKGLLRHHKSDSNRQLSGFEITILRSGSKNEPNSEPEYAPDTEPNSSTEREPDTEPKGEPEGRNINKEIRDKSKEKRENSFLANASQPSSAKAKRKSDPPKGSYQKMIAAHKAWIEGQKGMPQIIAEKDGATFKRARAVMGAYLNLNNPDADHEIEMPTLWQKILDGHATAPAWLHDKITLHQISHHIQDFLNHVTNLSKHQQRLTAPMQPAKPQPTPEQLAAEEEDRKWQADQRRAAWEYRVRMAGKEPTEEAWQEYLKPLAKPHGY